MFILASNDDCQVVVGFEARWTNLVYFTWRIPFKTRNMWEVYVPFLAEGI